MLKLELWIHGNWYDLLCPDELRDEVRRIYPIKTMDHVQSFVEVSAFPQLRTWMRANQYSEQYIRVHHIPDVVETKFRPRLTLQNIEAEMQKLKDNMVAAGMLDDEDRPDYGVA